MKKTKFSEEQIVQALKQAIQGKPIPEICRDIGTSTWTFYQWRKKYQGIEVSDLKKMRELESENAKLKRLVANLSLDNMILKDVVSKKW
jgi:putative transposase